MICTDTDMYVHVKGTWLLLDYCRFVVAVFPSADDDVITSPYNR